MNVLLIGSGGREHALAWKISQSPKCEELYIAPGNAGTGEVGTNVYLSPTDFSALEELTTEKNIDLIVVGPEQPLVVGIADFFEAKGVPVIGPSQEGAQLEGSKAFSKAFMQRHGIPTASYQTFHEDQLDEALNYLAKQSYPIVVKASGLAAGKGVLICSSKEEASLAVTQMLSGNSFGSSGKSIVIEEFLEGIEVSVFILTDGKSYILLPTAKDYKRIGEGDTGLNTGGMGAVSPGPFSTEGFMKQVEKEIILPTLAGINTENIDFKGFIFFGLMVVEEKPYVLEYNVRMGDPETQVVMPRIQSDILEWFEAVARGRLDTCQVEVSPEYCTTVVLASQGYPGPYEKGKTIDGLDSIKESLVFQSGTLREGEQLVTNGGRICAISSLAGELEEAISKSQFYAKQIHFEGKYYRRDIGRDLLPKNL